MPDSAREDQVRALVRDDRSQLSRLGVTFGRHGGAVAVLLLGGQWPDGQLVDERQTVSGPGGPGDGAWAIAALAKVAA